MKYEWAMRSFGPTVASFSTEGHELHRIRRGALSPFFSKASVTQLQPAVRAVIAKFVARITALKGSGTPINLIDAYSALTNDVRVSLEVAIVRQADPITDYRPVCIRIVVQFSGDSRFLALVEQMHARFAGDFAFVQTISMAGASDKKNPACLHRSYEPKTGCSAERSKGSLYR